MKIKICVLFVVVFYTQSQILAFAQYSNDPNAKNQVLVLPNSEKIEYSEPMVAEISPGAVVQDAELHGEKRLFADPKKMKVKTPVTFMQQKYNVKLKPSKNNTQLLILSDQIEVCLYSILLDLNMNTRGVCLYESTPGFTRQFYLFAHEPFENYLVWTESFGLQMKEITQAKKAEDLIVDCAEKNNRDCSAIIFDQIPYALLLLACIDNNTENIVIENVLKDAKGKLRVNIKSKQSQTKFQFISSAFNIQNEKTPASERNKWRLDDQSVKACRDFQQKGYRMWFKRDSGQRVIARLIKIQEKSVQIEKMDGKKIELNLDELSEIDTDFIAKMAIQ